MEYYGIMSILIELAGFQHGRGFYHLKALAMNSIFGGRYCIRKFDTTDLLNANPDAWQTYCHQSATHGRLILDSGILSSSASLFRQLLVLLTSSRTGQVGTRKNGPYDPCFMGQRTPEDVAPPGPVGVIYPR